MEVGTMTGIDDGRKTGYRKKKRKTSLDVVG
jgi:hypothetical protein